MSRCLTFGWIIDSWQGRILLGVIVECRTNALKRNTYKVPTMFQTLILSQESTTSKQQNTALIELTFRWTNDLCGFMEFIFYVLTLWGHSNAESKAILFRVLLKVLILVAFNYWYEKVNSCQKS